MKFQLPANRRQEDCLTSALATERRKLKEEIKWCLRMANRYDQAFYFSMLLECEARRYAIHCLTGSRWYGPSIHRYPGAYTRSSFGGKYES